MGPLLCDSRRVARARADGGDQRSPRRPRARTRRDPPRPGAASGRLRSQPAPAARKGRRQTPVGYPPRPNPRQPDRTLHREPRSQELVASDERLAGEEESELEQYGWRGKPITLPRPGHADLAGVLKYGHHDVRNVLERASARETAATGGGGSGGQEALIQTIGCRGCGGHVAAGRQRARDGAPAWLPRS